MVSRVIPVDDFDLVIFGGTGDLARRKIIPALYRRFLSGQIQSHTKIIGAARTEMDAEGYRAFVVAALDEFIPGVGDVDQRAAFLECMDYVMVDAMGEAGWEALGARLGASDRIRAFYFSVGPSLFGALAERLHRHKIANDQTRIVVEKPFGRDLATAKALNAVLAEHFVEGQIYRIDHFLARKPCRTLWRSGLEICCLSRFGTANMSIIFRSRWRKRSGLAGAAGITINPARCAIWCKTILCNCFV